jgi:hypothetical protein
LIINKDIEWIHENLSGKAIFEEEEEEESNEESMID